MAEAAARRHLRTVTFKRQPGARRRHQSPVCFCLTRIEQVHIFDPHSSLCKISPRMKLAWHTASNHIRRKAPSAGLDQTALREGFSCICLAF